MDIGFTIYSISNINPVEQCFTVDIKIYCRWHDSAMGDDPDMVSLREHSKLAIGTVIKKLPNGKFPDEVIKHVSPSDVGTYQQ